MINTAHMICRRYAKGMTQVDLSRKVGITKDQIGRIERGEQVPRLSTLVSICSALDTDPNKLMGWK